MEQSLSLLSAQIQFLETNLALIHIPLNLYNHFLQPIISLLTPVTSDSDTRDPANWAYDNPFMNISVTPVECSVVCPRELATRFFNPARDELEPSLRQQCCISQDDYIVIQVYGDGLDAGKRVLELTSPLAMSGIPIFFITSYFSDFILVPLRARPVVIAALEARGFAFESHADAFVNIASPTSLHAHSHSRSASNRSYFPAPFTTLTSGPPPPSSIEELQARTLATLRRRNIRPQVDPTLTLVQCAARKYDSSNAEFASHTSPSFSPAGAATLLHLGVLRCLLARPRPRFMSMTLTDTEPPSLLLERRLMTNFADDDGAGRGEGLLVGSTHERDLLVPITLDLRELPEESTGIVCGIAGRLVGGTRSRPVTADEEDEHGATGPGGYGVSAWLQGMGGREAGGREEHGGSVEMSYLSTARAGTVMVAAYEIKRAMAALEGPQWPI